MNENIDLTKILKDCPKGTKLYSTVFGEVKFIGIKENAPYPIIVKVNNENFESFTADGRIIVYFDGDCTLFPSKDQRDWSKFTAPWYKKERFDPKTLNEFDRVLGSDCNNHTWKCDFFSHINERDLCPYKCVGNSYKFCIPYNDETKHLVGTKDEAPEFYRYWED